MENAPKEVAVLVNPNSRILALSSKRLGHHAFNVAIQVRVLLALPWGHSSAGRAPALHAGGQGFDPLWFHHHRSFILTNNYCSRAYRTRYIKIDKPVLLWAWNWFRPGLNPKWTSGYLGSNPSKSTNIWGYRSRVGQRTLTALMFVRVKLPLPNRKVAKWSNATSCNLLCREFESHPSFQFNILRMDHW